MHSTVNALVPAKTELAANFILVDQHACVQLHCCTDLLVPTFECSLYVAGEVMIVHQTKPDPIAHNPPAPGLFFIFEQSGSW